MASAPKRRVEDHYDIDRKIGEGASAETFLARDRNGQLVVVKSLHVEKLDGWKFFELFEREAQTLAALQHSGIPRFIEWFASSSDTGPPRFHIVQEFIEGRSLAAVIDEGGLGATEFDQLVLGMLDILHYLHSRTPPVFHRDIKPSNIIIGPMGSPVLIDFGSVCYGWRDGEERGSTVAGTHGYMPPEQYVGQVSARSDLYGLGATLLHTASGREPGEFSFDDGRINVPESLTVRPAVRRALDKLLEPAPRDRPQSAKEARELFIADETALVPIDRSTALAVRDGQRVTRLRTPEDVTCVNLGPPPRDPNGEFRDVYRSLSPPLTSMGIGVEGVNRKTSKPQPLFFILLLLATFGFWPLIRLTTASERRRRGTLFESGMFADATIVATSAENQASSRVTFEFEIEGETMRSSCLVASVDASRMLPQEVYGVLYEKGQPSNNVLVYR